MFDLELCEGKLYVLKVLIWVVYSQGMNTQVFKTSGMV